MNSEPENKNFEGDMIACIRKVRVKDLPEELQRMNRGRDSLYMLTSEDGDGLALARSREAAFSLARRNAYSPMSVH